MSSATPHVRCATALPPACFLCNITFNRPRPYAIQLMLNHATPRRFFGTPLRMRCALAPLMMLLLLVAFSSMADAAVRPVNIEGMRTVQPLAPFMEYLVDPSGTLTLNEVFSPSHQEHFKPLDHGIPLRAIGSVWLRMTIAPRPSDSSVQHLLLDLGDDLPGTARIYLPKRPAPAETTEWQEQAAEGRNVFTLPDPLGYAVPVYIKLEGVPGPWFAPQLRTPHNAATAFDRLARPAIIVALAVVMLLCLLRGLTERGEWRIWTSLFTAAALTQAVYGPPATPHGVIEAAALPSVLTPGIALMLLPHVARHMMRTRELAPRLDTQFMILSLPGAALALCPLLPGMAWTARFLPLWPLCMALLIPTSLGALLRRLPGARRFLLGCLAPIAGTAVSMLAIGSPAPAALIASGPMWGLAFGALVIAGSGSPKPRNAGSDNTADTSGLPGIDARNKRNPAARRDDLLDPLAGEPGLRLITPAEQKSERSASSLPDLSLGSAEPCDGVFAALDAPAFTRGSSRPQADGQNAVTATEASRIQGLAPLAGDATADASSLARMEDALRQPLDELQQAITELSDCALPPAARSLVETASIAGRRLATLAGDLRQTASGSVATPQRKAVFDLQRCLRDAHDAVSDRVEAKNLALSWFMAPHLAQVYEGDAQQVCTTLRLLVESAVRATEQGSIHLSVRRVPESTDPGHLLFTVSDTGAGGPPERRSSSSLARAWELAANSDGTLNIDSGPQGTNVSFSVRLVALSGDLIAPRAAIVEDLARPAGASAGPKPLRVIIADDVPSSRQLLTFYLEGLPHETIEARSASEAADLYQRAPSGLIILDGDMPEDSISEAIAAIRSHEGEHDLAPVPLLALVSHDEQGRRLLQAGCNDALAKPITRSGLRERVLHLAPIPRPDAPASPSNKLGMGAADEPTATAEHSTGDAASAPGEMPAADMPHNHDAWLDEDPLSLDAREKSTPSAPSTTGVPGSLSFDNDGPLAQGDDAANNTATAFSTGLVLGAAHPTDTETTTSAAINADAASALVLGEATVTPPAYLKRHGTATDKEDGLLLLADSPVPDGAAHEASPTQPRRGGSKADVLDMGSFADLRSAPEVIEAAPVVTESWYPWDRPADAREHVEAASRATISEEGKGKSKGKPEAESEAELGTELGTEPRAEANSTTKETTHREGVEQAKPSSGTLPDLFGDGQSAPELKEHELPLLDLILPEEEEAGAQVVPAHAIADAAFTAASARNAEAANAKTGSFASRNVPAGSAVTTGTVASSTHESAAPKAAAESKVPRVSVRATGMEPYTKASSTTGIPFPVPKPAPDMTLPSAHEKDNVSSVKASSVAAQAVDSAAGQRSGELPDAGVPGENMPGSDMSGDGVPGSDEPLGYDLAAVARATAALSAACAKLDEPAPIQLERDDDAQASALAATAVPPAPAVLSLLDQPDEIIPLKSAHGERMENSLAPLVPGLVDTLNAALEDALIGREQDDTLAIQEAAARIAGKSETFGLRVLERIARCVERAAAADDLDAVRDLLPELQAAVERNTIALKSSAVAKDNRK